MDTKTVVKALKKKGSPIKPWAITLKIAKIKFIKEKGAYYEYESRLNILNPLSWILLIGGVFVISLLVIWEDGFKEAINHLKDLDLKAAFKKSIGFIHKGEFKNL